MPTAGVWTTEAAPVEYDCGSNRVSRTVAGYFRFRAALKDRESGTSGEIEEELPLPTLGVGGEIPFRRFLLRADASGMYINTSAFEGTGIRMGGSLVWRPFKHIGVVGGYRYIFAHVDDGRDEYDIKLQSAYVGVEFRY